MQATVRLDHSFISLDAEHDVHAMLELAVPEPADAAARPPRRLALVLDRSGSMAGPKLDVAKRCAAWLVGKLGPRDELAFVHYDDEVFLSTPLGPVHAPSLERALALTLPGRQTNLSGGWLCGRQELAAAPADGPRKVLLLTDGLANVGIVEREPLVALAGAAYQNGIGTSTIGFGTDFDEDLLTAMAEAGGGNAHWAATPDAAPGIFASELEGLARVVAQNVTVEIRPVSDVEVIRVFEGYLTVPSERGVRVDIGDAYGGDRRRLVFGLHIPQLDTRGAVKVAELVLSYVSIGETIEAHKVTIPVVANLVSASEAAAAKPDLQVQEEVMVLKAAAARDEAVRLADEGEHADAKRILEDVSVDLRLQMNEMTPEQAATLEREAAALDEIAPLVDRTAYDAHRENRKRLRYEANRIRRRRKPEADA